MADTQNIAGFVLHLERATARRANADALVAGLQIPAKRWAAIDGAMLTQAQRQTCSKTPLFAPSYPFSLSDAEIAIFLAHRGIWQHIVDCDLQIALVLEDDVVLDHGAFDPAFALALSHVRDCGYIQFAWKSVDGASPKIASAGATHVYRPHVSHLGMQAYLISREACEALLSISAIFDRPVDTFVQSHWRSGLQVSCVAPGGLEHGTNEFGGSTAQIKKKRSVSQKLRREWKRWMYRNAVKRFSAKALR